MFSYSFLPEPGSWNIVLGDKDNRPCAGDVEISLEILLYVITGIWLP